MILHTPITGRFLSALPPSRGTELSASNTREFWADDIIGKPRPARYIRETPADISLFLTGSAANLQGKEKRAEAPGLGRGVAGEPDVLYRCWIFIDGDYIAMMRPIAASLRSRL